MVPISRLHASTGSGSAAAATPMREALTPVPSLLQQHAAPKQRAAINQTIGGNFRQTIAVTIFANAHDVLLAPAGNVSDLVGPDSMSLLPFQKFVVIDKPRMTLRLFRPLSNRLVTPQRVEFAKPLE